MPSVHQPLKYHFTTVGWATRRALGL